MADHDHGYKLLFSHPRMVEDLVRGFVPGGWVADLDFATLERVPASYVGEELEERRSDVVWRLRFRGEGWRQKALSPEGKLPAVLPIVLYNGHERWTAAVEVAELFTVPSPEVATYLPRLRYALIDEGRYGPAELERLSNLAAALFRLEQSRDGAEASRVLTGLAERLEREPDSASLRRAFGTWLRRVRRLLPTVAGGRLEGQGKEDPMLVEALTEWALDLKAEAHESGRKKGEAELLLRMLERKFGPLDEATRERIEAAEPEQLLDWGERFVTAARLAEVFGD